MISTTDVIQIVQFLEESGISIWLDGGWGVDALLGEQTRPHDDLDVVIGLEQAEATCRALAPLGFAVHDDERPTRFVLRDPIDRRIDVHTVTFDAQGGGIQILQDGTVWRYPPEGFGGGGTVGGRPVRCLTAEVQVRCHLGYEPDETDRHDLARLRARFGVELPAPFDEAG